MKKIFFPQNKTMIGWLLIAALSPACKRLIEIPPNPPTQITETQEFADSATAMTAIAGIYSYHSNGGGSFTFNDGFLSLCTGLSSDELSSSNTGDLNTQEFYTNNLTGFNSTVSGIWADPYTGLYPVNATLNGIAASNGLSASFKTQLTGELKVVRALYYFYLINLFDGVPLVTTTDYKAAAVLPRASVDSVYGQILADLRDAQQTLPADYPSAGRVRPNLYTVSAFLAKVHLYRQEWQKAYDAANTVIGSGLYSLEADLNNVFLDGSNEAIWQLPAKGTYNATQEAQNFVPYSSGTVPTYLLAPALTSAFEAGDQRLQKWAAQNTTTIGGVPQTFYSPFKYKNLYASSPTVEDFMIFRLGEQYLIRAEASAHLGNTADALTDLNQVRTRAGLPASAAVSQADVLNAIMHERQAELFCEWGNRWMDLKRTGTIDAVLGAEKSGWQTTDALYPVPNAQLQVNGQLTQNPGY